MEQRRGEGVGAHAPEQQRRGEERAAEGRRNVPGDDALPDQPQAADEITQGDPFAALAAEQAKGRAVHQLAGAQAVKLGVGVCGAAQRGAQGIQRRGAGDGVHLAQAAENQVELGFEIELPGGGPLGHQRRVGDDHQAEGGHCRVERVLAEPAVKLLDHDHGEQRAGDGEPPGRDGGKGEGDQPGGDDSREVGEEKRLGLAADGQHGGLAGKGGGRGNGELHQDAGAEEPHVGGDAGHEGEQHLEHDALDAGRFADEGGIVHR